mgnify:CR=1 FL=1
MDLPVVNHKDYVAKIGDDHKFPINKFGELAKYLIDQKIVKNFYNPLACSFETLNRAHSRNYINDIKNKTLDKNAIKKIGFPLVDSVVQRSLVATGGTVLASKLALNFGIACNTAGGSHHANYDGGAGYCVFNDQYKKTIILIGDSHMQTLEGSLLDFSNKNNFKLIIINKAACFYILDVNLFSKGKKTSCDIDYHNKIRSIIMSNNNSIVILGGRMTAYLNEDGFNNKEGQYEGKFELSFYDINKKIENLQDRKSFIKEKYKKTLIDLINNNHKVVLIYPIPEVGFHVSRKLIFNLGIYSNNLAELNKNKPLTTSYNVFLSRNKDTFDILDFVQNKNILRIYPHSIFCDKILKNRCVTHDDKDVFYIDDDHLSLKGSELVIKEINNNINFFKK